ncbi:TPA: SHOCT domain-containing protein [Enterococcus faecium]|uniref:SHOCT domain-containing protein n=2 Tax=Enterococcus faecium TaxID=1352 RepID=UPI00033038FB|nr:SHOCT domain-containing protein [Enterococcus faecium]EOH55844.1 hypothetical protein UA3_01025 [Enterococcus faecium EnGen0263]MEB7850260.1 SHOCT domain-containing protein [Enterococcus faecium]
MGLFGNSKKKEEKIKKKLLIQEENEEKKLLKKRQQEENLRKLKDFTPNRTIEKSIFIDTEKRQFKIKGLFNSSSIYDLDKINSYELVENGTSISSGGLGRAAIGALAFGGVGAIVGAVTGKKKDNTIIEHLNIKINMNDLDKPVIYLPLISKKTKRSSMLYKNAIVQADKILSTLDILLKETSKEQINIIAENQVFSPADELRKYKELLDDGIINQEEFNIKKKELLDL